MDRCFEDLQIPCRWVQNVVGFYGSPFFNYHAPLPYYFGELIFYLTSKLHFAVKSVFIFSFIACFIFIYLLLRKIRSRNTAVFLAVLGSLSFYFGLKLFNIEPVDKMWSLVFFVASFYAIVRLRKQTSLKNILFLELITAFLITSHQRSVIFFLPILAVFIFTQLASNKHVEFLIGSFSGIFLGLLLSSFYLVPMVFERNLVHANYLPVNVEEKLPQVPASRFEILTGQANITDYREGSNWINMKVETQGHTIIRLSQYYFPLWKIFVDGEEISVDYKNNSMGLMTFILGKGNHTINARMFDTPIRTLANLMTEAGMVLTVLLFFVSFVRVRKWIIYYRKGIN